MNCVESRREGDPIDPPPPAGLRVTIFSRLLGLNEDLNTAQSAFNTQMVLRILARIVRVVENLLKFFLPRH